jgi:hypothetical protein
VFEVGTDGVRAQGYDVRHHAALVVRFGFPLGERDRALGAVAHAGAKAIAEQVAHQARLAVDDLQRALGAVRDAEPAAVALLFVDGDDRSRAHGERMPSSAPWSLDVDQARQARV